MAALRRLLGGSLPGDLLDLLAIPAALGFLALLHPLFFAVGLGVLVLKTILAAGRRPRDADPDRGGDGGGGAWRQRADRGAAAA